LCAAFPGLLTPNSELIHAGLESYGEQIPPDSGRWHLRSQDTPQARAADLAEMRELLQQIGESLGFSTVERTGKDDILCYAWEETGEQPAYVFYISASAALGEIILTSQAPSQHAFIVLPGGRANLVMYKLRCDPRLEQAVQKGWRFLKFRHVRRLAESQLLTRETLDEQVALDPLTYTEPQIPLL